VFEPGIHYQAFSTSFRPNDIPQLTWIVDQWTATASMDHAPACDPPLFQYNWMPRFDIRGTWSSDITVLGGDITTILLNRNANLAYYAKTTLPGVPGNSARRLKANGAARAAGNTGTARPARTAGAPRHPGNSGAARRPRRSGYTGTICDQHGGTCRQ
jgi:hypothetical protein